MTEHWLIQDIKTLLKNRNKTLILDPGAQCTKQGGAKKVGERLLRTVEK